MTCEVEIPGSWYTWEFIQNPPRFKLHLKPFAEKLLKEAFGDMRFMTIDQRNTPRFVFLYDEDAVYFKLRYL